MKTLKDILLEATKSADRIRLDKAAARSAANRQKKMSEDPHSHRQKVRDAVARHREKKRAENPEAFKAKQKSNNDRAYEKRKNDPEAVEKNREKAFQYWKANKDNPEYRERNKANAKAWRERKKAEKLKNNE